MHRHWGCNFGMKHACNLIPALCREYGGNMHNPITLPESALSLTAFLDKAQQRIPERSLRSLVIDTAVYDIVQNICIYWGDLESCLSLEWESDRYIALPL